MKKKFVLRFFNLLLYTIILGFLFLPITSYGQCDPAPIGSPPPLTCAGLTIQVCVSSDYNGSDISCADSSDGVVCVSVLAGSGSYSYQWVGGPTAGGSPCIGRSDCSYNQGGAENVDRGFQTPATVRASTRTAEQGSRKG